MKKEDEALAAVCVFLWIISILITAVGFWNIGQQDYADGTVRWEKIVFTNQYNIAQTNIVKIEGWAQDH